MLTSPEPYERRNRAGQVLAVTKHLKARVRLFKGAFAHFTPEDLRPSSPSSAKASHASRSQVAAIRLVLSFDSRAASGRRSRAPVATNPEEGSFSATCVHSMDESTQARGVWRLKPEKSRAIP